MLPMLHVALVRREWAFAPIFLMLLLLQSCGAHPQSDLDTDQPPNTKEETALKPFSASPIADVPRRLLIKEVEWANKKTATIGVSTAFAGSTFAVETDIAMTMKFAMAAWLFAPGTDDALIDEGSVFLANRDDRPYNFICRYQGYIEIEPKFRQKLTLFGNGLTNETSQRDSTGVVQSSQAFPVAVGSSWPSVFEHCKRYAQETQMMDSVENDLMRMVKGMVYHDDQSACVSDNHCEDWHGTLLPGIESSTVPICQKSKEGPRFCNVRAVRGASCSLYDPKSGARLTSGMFEYPCQAGLSCKQKKAGGWFKGWELYSFAEGVCQ